MFKSSFIIYYDFYYNIFKNQHNRLEFMINIETLIFLSYFGRGPMSAALYIALSQEGPDGAAKDRILN